MVWRGWTGLLAGLALAAAAPQPWHGQFARHEGVASCGGTTCHGRQIADGAVVRQNELLTWQDDTSLTGAHSRALNVLDQPRAQAIAARLGIGAAATSPQCLGCHADTAARPRPALPAERRGRLRGVSWRLGALAGQPHARRRLPMPPTSRRA